MTSPGGERRAGGFLSSTAPAMLTDLYELTMAAAYRHLGLHRTASFELSIRSLPAQRRFLVMAGLDEALAGLEGFEFSAEDVAYLASLELFPSSFLDDLAGWRFTGDVEAVPEGEVVFAGEPLLRVTGSLVDGQLVETFLMNQVTSHTLVASKAARVTLACEGRDFVDFSARRDQGVSAALAAARTAWIAGSSGTSLVAAGQRWGIPVSGTMAHSYVMAFADEREAFRSYARLFPHSAVLLVDTYDTVAGVRNAIAVAEELGREGISIVGVRLDSGDIAELARRARTLLDDAGLGQVRIFVSGDLDEHRIADLVGSAPIDAFGVGTQLGTSADAPALGAGYKLVADSEGPKMKLAEGKVSLPGRKQVWRGSDGDLVALEDEDFEGGPPGRPLLRPVMEGGERCDGAACDLHAARERCRSALESLPAAVLSLAPADHSVWPVEISPGLGALSRELAGKVAGAGAGAVAS